ncbi:MAG: alanine racemase, partial [Fimbriimonadaceae bacterium]
AEAELEEQGRLFRQLAQMAQGVGLEQLSMGMSGDFETAIAHGATHVRIGSSLFGSRN